MFKITTCNPCKKCATDLIKRISLKPSQISRVGVWGVATEKLFRPHPLGTSENIFLENKVVFIYFYAEKE